MARFDMHTEYGRRTWARLQPTRTLAGYITAPREDIGEFADAVEDYVLELSADLEGVDTDTPHGAKLAAFGEIVEHLKADAALSPKERLVKVLKAALGVTEENTVPLKSGAVEACSR